MDKIHCYFFQCYDIGNRLSIKDKEKIHVDVDNVNENQAGTFINQQLLKINQLLCAKREKYTHIWQRMHQRVNKKYNQLFTDDKQQNIDDEMFSFGYHFQYGDDDEEFDDYELQTQEKRLVFAKYQSLKEEITSNDIFVMSIKQFNNEYKKASLHFHSYYCKQQFPDIKTKYLLSLMIYCNFSELQFEFSKTYREENGSKHHNFYYLAKYLKISVQKFGTKIKDGYVNAFYHGIGEQLLFPQYIGHSGYVYDGLGISIYCPLSTSSSILVGMNFTNVNNGLIVQFDGGYYENCKYFSVAWLSDFASESEYLFVQNEELLEIIDIIDVQFGFTNGKILSALKIIQTITKDGTLTVSISDAMQALVCKMIRNQLPHNLKLYKSFELSNEYTKQIVTTYFKNKNIIWMNYEKIKTEYSFFFNLLFHVKYEWL
eukprot:17991_1